MATYINNIFNFGRSLPSPFDTIANKKIKVSSKYGDGTTSTLCGTVIKAVHAVCHCMDGSGEGAVGIIDHRTAAEYKSSAGADAYHLVVYDSNTGTLLASVYDSNMETFENYTLNSSGRDGAAVMMALFPMLMQDDEFKENFEVYQDELNAGYPHMDKATEYMALMCDNAYRRIKDDSCAAHIKVNVDILHEYVMIVRKDSPVLIPILMTQRATVDIRDMPGATWRDVVAAVLEQCKEPVALSFLYEQIEPHKKAQSNKWWKEKIRQTLQINPMHFTHDGRGLWSLNRSAA